MDVGIKDTNAFQDGYSDRPWSMKIAVPQPERFREFAEMLMHNLVILDYTEERGVKKNGGAKENGGVKKDEGVKENVKEKEIGGRLKLFFFPMNLMDRIRVQFSRNDSFLIVDPAIGQATIHFPAKEYNAIYAPVSYHLLCEKIVSRIMTSYGFYLKDDEEEALNVFRYSWRNLDETGVKESLFRPEENQGLDEKERGPGFEGCPGLENQR